MFLAQQAMPQITSQFVGHYPLGGGFEPWQVISHMFMQEVGHLFFNMFALVVLSALERVWGLRDSSNSISLRNSAFNI